MKSKFFIITLVVCFTFLARIQLSQAAESTVAGEKDFLWKVSSKKTIVYLLGSIHLAKPDFYPLDRRIEESFGESDVLALEADPDKANDPEVQRQMLRSAFYAGKETLKGHLSRQTYDIAVSEMQRLGLPVEAFNKAKPWFLALTIGVLELRHLGFNQEYGIDKYFAGKARGKKKIVQLESFDYQINLLNSFTPHEQELFLIYTIRDMKNLENEMDRMITSWKTGDAESMESLMLETMSGSPELQQIFEKLYYGRNREMTVKIEQYLQSGDKYFIVVGSAHLVGKSGIVELLRKKGYKVEQL